MISTVRGTVLDARGGDRRDRGRRSRPRWSTSPRRRRSRSRVGAESFLHTALIVREDELSLFGFATRDELDLFDLLRGVSGVGPKSALGVLATLTPDDIARAVAERRRRAVPQGVRHRPEDREAHHHLARRQGRGAEPDRARRLLAAIGTDASVVAALVGLGWPEQVAAQAVEEVLAEATVEERATFRRCCGSRSLASVPGPPSSAWGAAHERPRPGRPRHQADPGVGGRARLRGRPASEDASPSSSGSTKVRGQLQLLLQAAAMQ